MAKHAKIAKMTKTCKNKITYKKITKIAKNKNDKDCKNK